MHHSYRIFRTWVWETFAIVTAVALVIAITVLLTAYNGEQPPDWGASLSLNALLALLSTILRAMLVVIVSQVISQRKWFWYDNRRARPLSDLQKFDSGSRGPLGAMLLIPTVSWNDTITMLAATILFASFLIGPFVQQASRTAECSFELAGQNASLPYAHYGSGGWICDTSTCTMQMQSPDARVAVLSVITSPTGVENQIRASCATGNCTFPSGASITSQDGGRIDGKETMHSTVGMCSKCTDVTSLVSRRLRDEKVDTRIEYSLPNGLEATLYPPPVPNERIFIKTESNVTWMGDLFTLELNRTHRWAYANVTFFSVDQDYVKLGDDYVCSPAEVTCSLANLTATTCSLYPCLRTYTTSVTKNELVETHVSSEPMQLDLLGQKLPAIMHHFNSSKYERKWYGGMFAAVKSPCQVDGQTFDILRNTSYPGGTTLDLYNMVDRVETASQRYAHQMITAPEQCIYRMDPDFVRAFSRILNDEIFNGACRLYDIGFEGTSCYQTSNGSRTYSDKNGFSRIGNDRVLQQLHNNGSHSFATVDSWFATFADTMTNRFRSEFGSGSFNESTAFNMTGATPNKLPRGEIQGLAWQTTSCVKMQWQWLLYPVILTLLTTILSSWTIFTSWKHRDERPVWKDSILPLIFYGHKTRAQGPEKPQKQSHDACTIHEEGGSSGVKPILLEADEMTEIGKKVAITFDWPNSAEMGLSSARDVQQEGMSLTSRRAPSDRTVSLHHNGDFYQPLHLPFSDHSEHETDQLTSMESSSFYENDNIPGAHNSRSHIASS